MQAASKKLNKTTIRKMTTNHQTVKPIVSRHAVTTTAILTTAITRIEEDANHVSQETQNRAKEKRRLTTLPIMPVAMQIPALMKNRLTTKTKTSKTSVHKKNVAQAIATVVIVKTATAAVMSLLKQSKKIRQKPMNKFVLSVNCIANVAHVASWSVVKR